MGTRAVPLPLGVSASVAPREAGAALSRSGDAVEVAVEVVSGEGRRRCKSLSVGESVRTHHAARRRRHGGAMTRGGPQRAQSTTPGAEEPCTTRRAAPPLPARMTVAPHHRPDRHIGVAMSNRRWLTAARSQRAQALDAFLGSWVTLDPLKRNDLGSKACRRRWRPGCNSSTTPRPTPAARAKPSWVASSRSSDGRATRS